MNRNSSKVKQIQHPNCTAMAVSHFTMKPVTSLDEHSPVKSPPTKEPHVKDIVQDSKSNKNYCDSNIETNTEFSYLLMHLLDTIILAYIRARLAVTLGNGRLPLSYSLLPLFEG